MTTHPTIERTSMRRLFTAAAAALTLGALAAGPALAGEHHDRDQGSRHQRVAHHKHHHADREHGRDRAGKHHRADKGRDRDRDQGSDHGKGGCKGGNCGPYKCKPGGCTPCKHGPGTCKKRPPCPPKHHKPRHPKPEQPKPPVVPEQPKPPVTPDQPDKPELIPPVTTRRQPPAKPKAPKPSTPTTKAPNRPVPAAQPSQELEQLPFTGPSRALVTFLVGFGLVLSGIGFLFATSFLRRPVPAPAKRRPSSEDWDHR
jgi:hypothetical protein